ncbi:MAG: FIST C-terminal domain-containing protein [Acidaminococcaceae bacterium]|nr:FIST C-terminal domain-containing protein [Acidaminococcaceae bacterium]
MDSIVLYTEEIDDLQEAVQDLFAQTEGFVLKKNSLAVLFTEEDTDYQELYNLLAENWKFPVIGCTAMAMLLGKQGYCGTGISVLLLTADDCEFAAGMTDDLTKGNYESQIADKIKELKGSLSSGIKLVICYGGMVTDEQDVAGDDIVAAIDKASGGAPLFGGLAADGFNFNGFRVFCNGKVKQSGQVMVLVSGNIEPKFVYANSIENRASFFYEVTESKSNQVIRLGNGSFIDALKREDMQVSKTDVLGDYILSPFVLTIHQPNGDSVEVARNLSVLNQETGAGCFLGAIPEGSTLSIGIINRSDVQKSVNSSIDKILLEIKEHGYKTLLCTSCCARFLALASNINAEVEAYTGRVPEGVSLAGLYSYGEYCPVRGNKTGEFYNMFHNFTFAILAI